jgi:tripartite-type tricarboxylate transporter receptor subunit TctC
MAGGGAGSPDHMAGELFKIETRVKIAYVPYRGLAPTLGDLIGGQVQVVFSSVPTAIEFIKAGKLRALGACLSNLNWETKESELL